MTAKEKQTLLDIWGYLEGIRSMNTNSLMDAEMWLKDKECSNISSTQNQIIRMKKEDRKLKKCLILIAKQLKN